MLFDKPKNYTIVCPAMHPHLETISREEALWVLTDLCQRHRRPFDSALFLTRHPMGDSGRYTVADLMLLLAEALGAPPGTMVCPQVLSPFHDRWPAWHQRRRNPK